MSSRSYGSAELVNEHGVYTNQDGTTYVFATNPEKFELIIEATPACAPRLTRILAEHYVASNDPERPQLPDRLPDAKFFQLFGGSAGPVFVGCG